MPEILNPASRPLIPVGGERLDFGLQPAGIWPPRGIIRAFIFSRFEPIDKISFRDDAQKMPRSLSDPWKWMMIQFSKSFAIWEKSWKE
jgi:hypothetical protein